MRFDLICMRRPWPAERLPEQEGEPSKADAFWFMAVQALGKLMRSDHLIAAHLTFALLQETLVLEMLRRDQRTGASFHRHGKAEPLAYRQVTVPTVFSDRESEDGREIARMLYAAAFAYDTLTMCGRFGAFEQIWRSYLI